MTQAIKTLDDLAWASENNPKLVKQAKEQASIIEDLEKYLEWLYDEEVTTVVTSELNRDKARSLGIHPSSACKRGVCLLKLHYECTGELPARRAYEAGTQRIWDTGTLLHDTYQAHFNSMFGDQFEDEVPLRSEELHIKSHADGVFDFSLVRSVLEMKSVKEGGNFGWAKIQKQPFKDNIRQSHFYMKLKDAPFANILYIAKNTGDLKEYVIEFDFDLWDELEEEVILPVIQSAYNKGPPVKATAGWGCRYCDFNYACPAIKKERKHVKGPSRTWSARR